MIVTTQVEKITPNTTNGYGLKVTFTYTSFDKKEIDFIEEQARKITDTVTVMEVKAAESKVNADDRVSN